MTFAQEMVQKIEAILLGKADSDIKRFDYNGRSLEKYSFEELMVLRDKFRAEILAEQRAQQGKSTIGNIRVRF